jgi:hypothetical protein
MMEIVEDGMKALIAAMAFAAATAGGIGLATAQSNGPPGAPIEHVGPMSPSGEPLNSPPAQAPALTAAQKAAIFSSVTLDKSKIKPADTFPVAVGAQVPPAVELYPLPEGVLAEAPVARPYRYTMVANQVVLVDPGTMRVVDVIKP